MNIKTKLSFGILFLFVEFLIISLLSLFYIYKISQQNNLITRNNNLSIGYAENMLKATDRINEIKTSSIFNPTYLINENEIPKYVTEFETNLINEENNITETGEKELAKTVRDGFDKFKVLLSDSVENSIKDKSGFYYANLLPEVNEIKSALFAISDVNMNAIVRKNMTANRTATHSYIVLSAIATICFIVFFAFIFSFPKYIAEPIEVLANNLKEITNKNYESRMDFNTNDEFGEISKEFNNLIDKLKRYEDVEVGKILADKQRAESIINMFNEPVIVLDEDQNITLINFIAEKLLGLNRLNIINKKASEVAANNELLNFMIRDLSQNEAKPPKLFTQTIDGIKTVYTSKLDIMTTYDNIKDTVAIIGYKITLIKVSKAFD
jgi:PAS domain-containing protein